MATNNTTGTTGTPGSTPSNRGFAAMDPRAQREIARKGGAAVSQDREHMAAIGRKGGEASGGGNRANANTDATRDASGRSDDASNARSSNIEKQRSDRGSSRSDSLDTNSVRNNSAARDGDTSRSTH